MTEYNQGKNITWGYVKGNLEKKKEDDKIDYPRTVENYKRCHIYLMEIPEGEEGKEQRNNLK